MSSTIGGKSGLSAAFVVIFMFLFRPK
jgi:hypothetical protein